MVNKLASYENTLPAAPAKAGYTGGREVEIPAFAGMTISYFVVLYVLD